VALFATHGGRALIERQREAAAGLPGGAYLVYEIGASQAYALLEGSDATIWEPGELRRDLAGLDRNLIWKRRPHLRG
jgi:hypothetical protein